MRDLALMSIFVNHSLYVSYSFIPDMGPGCYNMYFQIYTLKGTLPYVILKIIIWFKRLAIIG
jgi:hypothetical protein